MTVAVVSDGGWPGSTAASGIWWPGSSGSASGGETLRLALGLRLTALIVTLSESAGTVSA